MDRINLIETVTKGSHVRKTVDPELIIGDKDNGYIPGDILDANAVVDLCEEGVGQVQSDWSQTDNTKRDYIKNKPDLSGFITKSVDDLTNYYLKSETYTKEEVTSLIGAIYQFHYEIYASTSGVTDPQGNVLYLIGPTGSGSDKYEEYVYDSGQQTPWVKIGDTTIDLSGYVTTDALNTALSSYYTKTAADAKFVASTTIRNAVVLTQNEYNALVTKDSNTEYNII